MARVNEGSHILPATHTFMHEWNEPSCLHPVSIHQMAPPERGSTHPITACYSFINLDAVSTRGNPYKVLLKVNRVNVRRHFFTE